MSLLIQWPRSQTSSHPNGNLDLRKVVLGRRHVLSVVFPSSESLTTQIHSSETPVHTPPASMGGNTLPRPTRQTPIPGSRYGFHLPSPTADSTTSRGNSTVPSASRSTSMVSSSFQGSVPPPHETTLQLLCPGVALSLPCPRAEHLQLPSLYRLHPCLSGPRKSYNESKTVNLVHCPELSLSMTSMLSCDHKVFPLPRRHHMLIMQTKMVSPSIVMIAMAPPLTAPLLMKLTLMRYLLTRMKGWLKRHCTLSRTKRVWYCGHGES